MTSTQLHRIISNRRLAADARRCAEQHCLDLAQKLALGATADELSKQLDDLASVFHLANDRAQMADALCELAQPRTSTREMVRN